MSFTSTSVLLIFIILGQLNQTTSDVALKKLDSNEAVYEALKLSCNDLSKTGPLADINFKQIIEFQRQSLIRLEKKKQEFVKKQCEEQTKDYLRDYFLSQMINPNKELFIIPGSSLEQKVTPTVALKEEEVKPFACDEARAVTEFSKEFGSGEEGGLDDQLKIFGDFKIPDLIEFWDYFCDQSPAAPLPRQINYQEIATQFNTLLTETDNIDLSFLEQFRTTRGADIYDDQGKWVGPFMDQGKVIDFIPLSEMPEHLKQAFVAAEDKNFYTHRGIEAQGVLRGFFKYLKDGSIEGGSTITQQLVKNLIIGNDINLDRKAREMLVARRVENKISKDQILEAYLNIVNLGRGSQGIATAVKRYFGTDTKVKDLSLAQSAYFAGITHGPTRYNPSFAPPARIKSRQNYVFKQMIEAKMISEEEAKASLDQDLPFSALEFPRMSYFQAAASEEYLRTTDENSPRPEKIVSTQNSALQNQIDTLVQKQLSEFEMKTGKVYWRGPLRNISYLWDSLKTQPNLAEQTDIWKDELIKSQSLFTGVKWQVVVLLNKQNQYQIGVINYLGQVEIQRLSFGDIGGSWFTSIRDRLKVGDVIFAEKKNDQYFFRAPPTLQSSVVVMDVNTGEVKALSGGFNYSITPYNRATKSIRSPGSTVKPFTYLAALDRGLDRTQLISTAPLTLSSIPGCDSWSPNNFSTSAAGMMSLESGLISSNNRLTAHLLNSISYQPMQSLEYVYNIMIDFGLYDYVEEDRICYPLILGSNDVTLLRLANSYAAFANGGWVFKPTFLKNENRVFNARPISKVNRRTLGTLSEILSRVVTQGTGYALRRYQGVVAGKTGTSSNHRDTWFVGYTNHHVVAAWLGYDQDHTINLNGQRVRLQMGSNNTGGSLVAPLVGEIFSALFEPLGLDAKALDPGSPLNYSPNQYAINQIWGDQIYSDQLASNDEPAAETWYPIGATLLDNPLSSSFDRTASEDTESSPISNITPIARPEAIGAVDVQTQEIEAAEPSREVIEVLKEDSLQRMRDRRNDLMNITNEGE